MESANLHHHHHQKDLVGSSSSSSPPPLPTSTGTPSYCYAAAAGSNHAWSTPNLILNTGSLNPNHHDGANFNSRGSSEGNESFNRHHHSSMIQNFGLPWTSSNKIKEELSMSLTDSNFPKFTEMLSSPSSSIEDFRLPLATKSDELNVDMSEKLLLKTISASSFHFNDHQLGDQHFYSNANHFGSTAVMPSRSAGSFSQIYPSINISNLNQTNSASAFSSSSSLEMNLQALDLLTNARFSGHHQPSSCDNLDMFSSAGFDHHLQQSQHHRSSCSPSKVEISAFPKGTTEPKRPNSSSSLAEPSHMPKKSRTESRPSCPPFKVRKEKLGDRIAALQQLVAPFGKTDTASVLMEAIGYIQFLQNQVKTLSVPYMKSIRSKPSRTLHGGRSSSDQDGNIEEERRDLRSRGLCLVPLSCMSYVANVDSGSSCGVWPPPPTYGGAGGI